MIKILVADDHELFREGLRRILAPIAGISVMGEAGNGQAAVEFCLENNVDVVLMDLKMPGLGGYQATQKILENDPDMRILVLTTYNNDFYPVRLLQEGALGYITKEAHADDLVQAIRQVYTGQRYIPSSLAKQMAIRSLTDREASPFDELSARELEVTLLITRGIKVKEIAELLTVSPKTVNSYRYRIFEKLNITGDVSLTLLATRYQLIEREPMLGDIMEPVANSEV